MIKIWKRIKTSDQQKIERILNKNEKEKEKITLEALAVNTKHKIKLIGKKIHKNT